MSKHTKTFLGFEFFPANILDSCKSEWHIVSEYFAYFQLMTYSTYLNFTWQYFVSFYFMKNEKPLHIIASAKYEKTFI